MESPLKERLTRIMLCGKVRLPEFLQQKLQPKEGLIIQIDNVNLYDKRDDVILEEERS
jgi:tRNA-specific 2-thiouridylase